MGVLDGLNVSRKCRSNKSPVPAQDDVMVGVRFRMTSY
jgi:hypothetical protein